MPTTRAQIQQFANIPAALTERFWAKVNRDGPIPSNRPDLGPCYLWTASLDGKGYGQIAVRCADGKTRPRRAHRVGYELQVGPIPDGLELDHLCQNPPCVRGSHLEPVSHRENTLRGPSVKMVTRREGVCGRGHLIEGANALRHRNGKWVRCRECQNQWHREHPRNKKAVAP